MRGLNPALDSIPCCGTPLIHTVEGRQNGFTTYVYHSLECGTCGRKEVSRSVIGLIDDWNRSIRNERGDKLLEIT